MSSVRSRGWEAFKRIAPDVEFVNYVIAAVEFRHAHGRPPVAAGDPRFSINDFIFDRIIRPPWTKPLSRFVDKITSKEEALRLCPEVLVPQTRAVLDVAAITCAEQLRHELSPYAHRDMIAKPAHASGAVLRTSADYSERDLRRLLKVSRRDYFSRMREPQYKGLAKRIVVEDVLRDESGGMPDDYKFICIGGRPILCQVNHGRLSGAHHRRLFRTPEFEPFDDQDGMSFPAEWRMADADRLERMHRIAMTLAQTFDYVRIDLYNVPQGVYFGEFTFTPGASLGCAPSRTRATHERYSKYMLQALAAVATGRSAEFGDGGVAWPVLDVASTLSLG